MTVSLAIETSRPNGTSFRLALGITMPLALISTVAAALAKLF